MLKTLMTLVTSEMSLLWKDHYVKGMDGCMKPMERTGISLGQPECSLIS